MRSVGWELSEETMPESVFHDRAVALLFSILAAWAARAGAEVFRNLAVRWEEENPRIGVDPDISVFAPPPPNSESLRSIRTWMPGHAPPVVAVEVVSETNPHKDYATAPDRYAACGAGELWVFDPLLSGPSSHGGPFRIQLWYRDAQGDFVRIYAGDGPVRSPAIGAWLGPVDEGLRLRLADDPKGSSLWLTAEESATSGREEARRAAEQERLAKEAALRRVAELEAQIAAKA